MAAPTLTRPAQAINHSGITPTAPLYRSALAPTGYVADGMTIPNTTGRYGCRYTLAAPVDISSYQYLFFVIRQIGYTITRFDTLANGGASILLFDASGNWSRFILAFSGAPKNYTSSFTLDNSGQWNGYGTLDTDQENDFIIELSKTPEETNGSLNLSQVAGYELHIGVAIATASASAYVYRFAAFNQPIIKNGDIASPVKASSINSLFLSGWNGTTAPYKLPRQGASTSRLYDGAISNQYILRHGFDIGDGATATRAADSNFALTLTPSYRTTRDYYAAQQFATNPVIRVNQSASCYLAWSTFSISGVAIDGGEVDFEITGSSSATSSLSNGSFYGCGVVSIEHGAVDTVTFEKCAEIVFGVDAVYSNCAIRGNTWSGSKGLTINAAPGDYSSVDIRFSDNTGGHDIEITPTSAGTYDLSGLSVKSGQSLKIHNTTATAITVKLATGVSATTSGTGAITIETPTVLANASITGLVAGSNVRIYNQTTATEIHNAIIAGTSYSADYIEGSDYTAGDVVSVRVAWMSGASAKVPVEYLTVATVNGWSVLANQQDDAVYNYNAIDGDTVTEFIPDYPNVQVDISDPDGVTTVQRAYAWYISGQMTADGLRYYHGSLTAEDSVNYRINTSVIDLKAQNLNPDPVYVIGGRLYRDDGQNYAVAGGGGVIAEYGRAYTVQTVGTPIVTGDIADISAALAAIPTNPLLTNDARLDNLDSRVSDCLQASDYTAAPTLSEIEASTILAKEATVASRLAAADYTAPDDTATLAAIAALNDISAADVLAAAQAAPIHADLRKAVGVEYHGDGSEANKLRSVLVP